MNYLNPNKNPSGAYGNLQSYPVAGLLAFPDEFLPEFFKDGKKCAGFVTIEDDGTTVTACTWDEETYQAYIATLPEDTGDAETEETTESIQADTDEAIVDLDYRLTLLELGITE